MRQKHIEAVSLFDLPYTQARVILVGDRVRRGAVRKADYLLRYTDGFSVAVVEAKSDDELAEVGLEQAKGYAQDLGLAFAHATNGKSIIEFDSEDSEGKLAVTPFR